MTLPDGSWFGARSECSFSAYDVYGKPGILSKKLFGLRFFALGPPTAVEGKVRCGRLFGFAFDLALAGRARIHWACA